MEALRWLSAWIRPEHLEAATCDARRAAFAADLARVAVIDSLLHDAIADQAYEFLTRHAVFDTSFGLYSRPAPVTEREWELAVEHDRFARFDIMIGEDWRCARVPERAAFNGLRDALTEPRSAAFFEAICGVPLGLPTEPNVMIVRDGQFLRRHNDLGQRRRIAYVLYLAQGWRDELGGSLEIVARDGSVTRVPAGYNRMVIFDVTAQAGHRVVPVSGSGDRVRLSVAGWIREP